MNALGQLEQVLTNLVANARDALAGQGAVTIATATVEVDASAARQFGLDRPEPCVRLAVSDTGAGIDLAAQARLFEPCFTTKAPGRGNGIGLATVRDIVARRGGSIRVASAAIQGTTFEVYLPAVDARPPAPDARADGGARGRETVLIVEDELPVRELMRDVLRLHGYTVLEAREGGEALDHARRHPGPIHLVILDVVVPGTSGQSLGQRLAVERPGVKTLYVSGYTDDVIRQQGLLLGGAAFLQKPFTVDDLARRVREVLDQG